MTVRYGPRAINQPPMPIQITARSLLLVSSGTVRKCEKESMMAKFRKRMVKWGLATAKVGLATAAIMGAQSAIAGPITSGAHSQYKSAWYFLSQRLVAGISRSDRSTGQHAAGEPLGNHQWLLRLQHRRSDASRPR